LPDRIVNRTPVPVRGSLCFQYFAKTGQQQDYGRLDRAADSVYIFAFT